MIIKWANHVRLGSPSASVTQTSSDGLLYYTELSSSRQQKVEIKRGLFATYWINIKDWAIGDVMWCRADDHTADSASLETRNQNPDPPASTFNHIMSNFPLILNNRVHARHTQATATVSPLSSSPLGKTSLRTTPQSLLQPETSCTGPSKLCFRWSFM